MGMFVRQRWNDTRLSYEPIPGFSLLELDNALMSKVWVPDLFFPSEKKAEVHKVTVPNRLMHIYPDGRIVYSQRYMNAVVESVSTGTVVPTKPSILSLFCNEFKNFNITRA